MNGSHGILGIGRVLIDHVVVVPTYPEVDTKTLVSKQWRQIGGPVPIALSTASHFGVETSFLSNVGEEAAGLEILAELEARGLKVHACERTGESGFAQIWTEAETGRRTIAACPGTELTELSEAKVSDVVAGCQILHLDGTSSSVAEACAIEMLKQGGRVVLDAGSKKPGMEDILPHVSLLIASDLFCKSWFGTASPSNAQLLSLGASAVVRTAGAEGATYFDATTELHRPAIDIKPVDTNGAGDIFCGAWLVGLSRGWATTRTLEFANSVAGYSCQFEGNTSLPRNIE